MSSPPLSSSEVNALRAAFLRFARSVPRAPSPRPTDSPELRRVRLLSASESSDPSTLPATAINALRRSRVQSVLSAAEGSGGVAAATAGGATDRGSIGGNTGGASVVDGAGSAVDGFGLDPAPRLRSRANSTASAGAVSLSSPLSFDGASPSRGSPARPTHRAQLTPPISPHKAPSNTTVTSIAEVTDADEATIFTPSLHSSPRVVVLSTHRTADSAHPPGHCPNRLRPAITSLVRKVSVSSTSRPGSAGGLAVDSVGGSSVSSADFGSSVCEHAGGNAGGHASGGGDLLDGASPLQRSRSRDASGGGVPLSATSPAEVALRRLQDRVSIVGGSAAFSHPTAALHTSPHVSSPPSSQRSPTHSPLASPSVTPAITRARIASLSTSLEPDTDPFVSRMSHSGVFATSGSGASSPARGMTPPNVFHSSTRPPELPRRWSMSTASKIPHVLTADAAVSSLCAASPSSPTPCTSPNDLSRLSPTQMVVGADAAANAPTTVPSNAPTTVPDVASLLSGLLAGVDVGADDSLKLSRVDLQSVFSSVPGIALAPEANHVDAGALLSWSEVLTLARRR